MKHVISYKDRECYVTQNDPDGKVDVNLALEAGIPAHEMVGEDGRKGVDALMDLAVENVCKLRSFAESLDNNSKLLVDGALNKQEKYNLRMKRQINFNRYLNDNNRMNFEGNK
jgi:hypothetical protein